MNRYDIIKLSLDVMNGYVSLADVIDITKEIKQEVARDLSSELCVLIDVTLDKFYSELSDDQIESLQKARKMYAILSCGDEVKNLMRAYDFSTLGFNEGVFTANIDDLEMPIVGIHEHKHITDNMLRLVETYYIGSNGLKYREVTIPDVIVECNPRFLDEALLSEREVNLQLLFAELDK